MLDAFFGAFCRVARRVGCFRSHFDAHTYPSTHSSRHLPSPLTVSSLHSLSLTTTKHKRRRPIALPSSTPHTTKTAALVLNETRLAREYRRSTRCIRLYTFESRGGPA